MNTSGDAAEQVVRMSLEGTEVVLKLTGSAAKNIAAAIYTVWKDRDKDKSKGHQRLASMLKSGKQLTVFPIKAEHLKQFSTEAKRYGVVYCALKGKGEIKDGIVDVLVRAEDAARINRIVERFKLGEVEPTTVEHDKAPILEETAPPPPEHIRPGRDSMDDLVDEMLSPPGTEARSNTNPTAARTEKSAPSAPISKTPPKAAEGTVKERPSVREALREIMSEREQRAERPAAKEKPLSRNSTAPKHLKPSEKTKVR